MLCDALGLSNILDFSHRPVFLRSTFLSIFFGHFPLLSPSKNVVSILCLSLFKVKQKKPNEPENIKVYQQKEFINYPYPFSTLYFISICAQLTMNAQSRSFLFLQLSVISWLPVISVQRKSCPIAWD